MKYVAIYGLAGLVSLAMLLIRNHLENKKRKDVL